MPNRVVKFNHILDLNLLSDNPVIVDAGANIGGYISEIKKLNLNPKRIIALECSKTNFEKLVNNHFENVTLIEKALGGKEGEATFTEFIGPTKSDGTKKYHQWGNINGNFKNTLKNNAKIKEYNVDVITLDKIMELYDLETIDFLKMDIEGGEYDVIDSINKDLAKKIKQISLETHNVNKNPSLIKKLKSLGYSVEEHDGLEIYAYR
jgi:FkbM family methyltransferase